MLFASQDWIRTLARESTKSWDPELKFAPAILNDWPALIIPPPGKTL